MEDGAWGVELRDGGEEGESGGLDERGRWGGRGGEREVEEDEEVMAGGAREGGREGEVGELGHLDVEGPDQEDLRIRRVCYRDQGVHRLSPFPSATPSKPLSSLRAQTHPPSPLLSSLSSLLLFPLILTQKVQTPPNKTPPTSPVQSHLHTPEERVRSAFSPPNRPRTREEGEASSSTHSDPPRTNCWRAKRN